MAKIDLEKVLIALLDSPFNKQFDDKIKNALKEQGLEYKDGEIVEVQKPKFHEGEWVVDEQGDCFIINSIERGFYFTQLSGCCYQTPLDIDLVDNSYHAWTIEDAKDGDVLASQYNKPFIYNGNHSSFHIGSYCGISVEDRFNVATEKCHWTENVNIHPATNAQRYTLEMAITNAGYRWNKGKLKLERI